MPVQPINMRNRLESVMFGNVGWNMHTTLILCKYYLQTETYIRDKLTHTLYIKKKEKDSILCL